MRDVGDISNARRASAPAARRHSLRVHNSRTLTQLRTYVRYLTQAREGKNDGLLGATENRVVQIARSVCNSCRGCRCAQTTWVRVCWMGNTGLRVPHTKKTTRNDVCEQRGVTSGRGGPMRAREQIRSQPGARCDNEMQKFATNTTDTTFATVS